MKRILQFAVLMLFAFSGPALAGIGEGDTEIGFDYGSTQLDSDTGLDSATSLALRGGYFLNQRFQLEGQFASNSEDTEISGIDTDAQIRMYMVNGVYNFQTKKKDLVPYVMVGVGMADSQIEQSGTTVDDNAVAYQVGAGTRFFFGKNKRTAFRFDVAMISESTFDESSTHTNISGGFSWKIGGGR